MSGIAGAIGSPRLVLAPAVALMGNKLRHRGSDVTRTIERTTSADHGGVFWGGQSRRNAVNDIEAAAVTDDADTGVVVSFAGTLYNRRHLGQTLAQSGAAPRLGNDAEIALRTYLLHGKDLFSRMEGAYSLAIFDPRQKVTLLARDRLGLKPLYYGRIERDGKRVFLFGSELRALLVSDLFPRRLDRAGFETFVFNGFVMAPHTMVEGVRSVLPGTFLTVDLERLGIEQRRYWSIPEHLGSHASQKSGRTRSDTAPHPGQSTGGEAVAELRRGLLEAVGRHLEADGEVGLFLSGGIDSSAVVALATDVGTRPVRTFNVSFEESAFDESSYAKAVSKQLGTEHHEIRLSAKMFQDRLDDALHSLDQPSFDALNSYMVSRAVREAGVHVALGGTGGDDLFGGNRTFVDIPKAMKLGRVLSFLPDTALDPLTFWVARLKAGRSSLVPPQTRWGKVRDVALTEGDLVELYQVAYALFTDRFLKRLLPTQDPTVRFGLPVQRMAELRSLIRTSSLFYAIAMLELSIFVSDRLLRDIDSVSMSVGLEVRSPLLDERVIDVWTTVDERLLFEPLLTKRILRDAALQRLDPSLFDRPKAGFVLPFEVWCRQSLKRVLDATFFDRDLVLSVGLDPDVVAALWRGFENGEPGLYWSRIWSLFAGLWWCRTYGVGL